MLFKPLFTAAVFALSASASPISLPSNWDMVSSLDMVIISDKNDALISYSHHEHIAIGYCIAIRISCCSDLSKDFSLLSVGANILYLILNGCSSLAFRLRKLPMKFVQSKQEEFGLEIRGKKNNARPVAIVSEYDALPPSSSPRYLSSLRSCGAGRFRRAFAHFLCLFPVGNYDI
jgi:hypothetical protein